MGNLPERWHRRILRSVVHARDPKKLKQLVQKGLDVNMVISDVFWDTPLTYAVKCGYLEVVEALVSLKECDIDQCNRNKHSALDEAICAWLLGASSLNENKPYIGKQFRILRCLLSAGAKRITFPFLDMLLFSALTTTEGHKCVAKLVRVFCEHGCEQVKSALLSVLVPYKHTAHYIWTLVKCGALPQYYLRKTSARPFMPLDNAILLVKACNHTPLLTRIDCDTSGQLDSSTIDWTKYKLVLRLLTLSGHCVSAHVMQYLYHNHADIYSWIAKYSRQPRKLSHLCRVVVRQHLMPSVPVAIGSTQQIPRNLKHCLVFEKVM